MQKKQKKSPREAGQTSVFHKFKTLNMKNNERFLCLEYASYALVKNLTLPSVCQQQSLFPVCLSRCFVLTSAACHRLSPFKRIAVTTVYVSPSNQVTPLGLPANQHSLSRLNPPHPTQHPPKGRVEGAKSVYSGQEGMTMKGAREL